jgi:uracil-DNA glycosylase
MSFGDVSGSPVRLTHWAPQAWPVASDWSPLVNRFFQSDAGLALSRKIQTRLDAGAIIYPPEPLQALALTPLCSVKVVILGQDPYHGPGQAHGLAFSVPPGIKVPPSLRNIQKEIARDPAAQSAGEKPSVTGLQNGSLIGWAKQGVLLLNSTLTVEDGAPASHAKLGWEALTDEIIKILWERFSPTVFMLWGNHAQAKARLMADQATAQTGDPPAKQGISGSKQCILRANHPSPLSALRPPTPFMGSGHFGLANAFLRQNGLTPVQW